MYRKIFFIAINLSSMTSFLKVSILLCVASINLFLNFRFRPYVFQELNVLEFYSLLSTIFMLFTGALYISEIGDNLKAMCFLSIILVNSAFCLSWFCSIVSLTFFNNWEKFEKVFPKFTFKLLSILDNIQKLNVVRYLKRMMTTKNHDKKSKKNRRV